MSHNFKQDLLITQDGQENHTYNTVLGRFVDNNRPAAESPDHIDVMYDERLVGNFQDKLHALMLDFDPVAEPNKEVDLFFTDEEEYNTFISLAFNRTSVVNVSTKPSGVKWGISKDMTTEPSEGVEAVTYKTAILLDAQPFEYSDDDITYYGLRIKLRDISVKTTSPLNQSQVAVASAQLPTAVKAAFDAGHIPSKEVLTSLTDIILGDTGAGLVFDTPAKFQLFYTALTGKTTLPLEQRTVVRDLQPLEGTIDVYNIDQFTSFGKKYFVVAAKTVNVDGSPVTTGSSGT